MRCERVYKWPGEGNDRQCCNLAIWKIFNGGVTTELSKTNILVCNDCMMNTNFFYMPKQNIKES